MNDISTAAEMPNADAGDRSEGAPTAPHASAASGTAQTAATASPMPWMDAYPEGIDWNHPLKGEPLFSLMERAVRDHPDGVCTNFLGRKLTYRQIGALVDRAAAGLQARGIQKGDKVGILLPNTPTYVVFYYAILKIGGTVVNYNPLYTVDELDFQVRDSGTEWMVTLDLKMTFEKVEALLEKGTLKTAIVCDFASLLPALTSALFKVFKSAERANPKASAQIDHIIVEKTLLDNSGHAAVPEIDPDNDLAVIQYTGGTTGTPKGAMLTHANLSVNVQQLFAWAPHFQVGKEKGFAALPFFHVFAMTTILNFGVGSASEIVMMPRFQVDDGLKLIAKTKPTFMPGVPTLYNAIMNHPKIGDYDLSSLHMCISGGAPLPLDIKRGFEKITGCFLVEGYGLSESSPVATCNPLEGRTKEGSIGQPVPGTLVEIRSLTDPEQVLPVGEDGEICISGPQVMRGYWKNDAATRDVFVNGSLRTGDVGHLDEDGFIFIVDRIKDLIICSGYNVYPRVIEEAIYLHADVEEVTVIGIPDNYRGEAPKAFVKLREGASVSQEEMLQFLSAKLSKIEMPEEIEFRPELPKTMIGKLSKKELKQEEAARRDG